MSRGIRRLAQCLVATSSSDESKQSLYRKKIEKPINNSCGDHVPGLDLELVGSKIDILLSQ